MNEDRTPYALASPHHITLVLTTLHWLPVRKRVMFRTVMLVWKCLNSTAPDYISKLYVPVVSASGHQHLRSASTGLLHVPRARTMFGRRSLAVVGSTETRDDTAHFKTTAEVLSVPHLMCWQTEGTFTTARRCCGVFVILAPDIKVQTYLFTYISLVRR